MAEGGEISFEDWLLQIGGITEDGRRKLEKATVVSTTAVKYLTLDDITEIKLGVGDRGIFRAAWQALQPSDQPKPSIPSSDASEDSLLYLISDISKFMRSLPRSDASKVPI